MRPLLLALWLAVASGPAFALDTAAESAMVVDMKSGATLLAKNVDTPLPPASMSKLMTLNMVFEALRDGRLTLDDRFRVSEKAWRMGGSRMFVREGDRIRIEDLIRGVVVQSGNDASVVLAEGLAGSEAAFARQMNERAKELGMEGSTFTNATGWPHPEHRMTARDLTFLARRMVTEFPEYYPYFAETDFEWDGVAQKNRNPLLYLDLGADGLKTGHTEAAGYGLVASVKRGDRRIALVVAGLDSAKQRSVEAERLITWAFREFRTGELFAAGETIAEANVWLGADETVPLAPLEDVLATAPYTGMDDLKVSVRYDGPVPAPIAEGERLADLMVEAPGLPPMTFPLGAAAPVARGGLMSRLSAAAALFLEPSGAPAARE